MAIRSLSPYLHFDGQAAAAIELYQRVLDAKVEDKIRFADVPQMGASAAQGERIVHAALRVGANLLMMSDARPSSAPPPDVSGNGNISVTLDFEQVADLQRVFDGLAAGGKVVMPPHDTFYGGKMGVLIDPFGVRWMFNYSPPRA